MERQVDLVCVGACNLDIFFAHGRDSATQILQDSERTSPEGIDHLIAVFERENKKPTAILGGGQAANVAAAAANLGLRVALVSRVGCDDAGSIALADLGDVDLRFVSRTGKTTRAVILVSSEGHRNILLDSEQDDVLQTTQIDIPARHFHFTSLPSASDQQREMDLMARVRLLATTSLDGGALYSSGLSEFAELYRNATIVFATKDELGAMAATPEQTVHELLELGVRVVCQKEGKHGATVFTASGESFHVQAPEVSVVDASCAGDALAGAFLVGYLNQLSLPDATARAVEFASSTTTDWGRSAYVRAARRIAKPLVENPAAGTQSPGL